MQEYPDRRVWALNEHEVTRLCIDSAFTIDIWWRNDKRVDTSLTIVIEAAFVLRRGEHERQFNPEHGQTLGPVLDILHTPVESLTAYRDGRPVLRFIDGAEIIVGKDERYESWHTFGTGELADIGMLCSPHEGPPWGE